jgi:hypothetical protein
VPIVERMSRFLSRFCPAALVALTALIVAGPAQADPVGIRPARQGSSWLELRLTPGTAWRGRVVLVNAGSRPALQVLGSADAETGPGGAFALGPTDGGAGVGRWTSVARGAVLVPARGAVAVGVRVAVPPGTRPGRYAGGVVATSARRPTGPGIGIVERSGLRVVVTVTRT